jgi:IS5 family transposase
LFSLQQIDGLSNFELEKQFIDRIPFRKCLGFPEYIPENTTVYLFKKRIIGITKKKKYGNSCKANLIALV